MQTMQTMMQDPEMQAIMRDPETMGAALSSMLRESS